MFQVFKTVYTITLKFCKGPQKIGQSLQRFIQDDFTAASDNVYSDTNVEEIINIDAAQNAKFPNFAQIQEVEKPEPELPLFYDVPIKIEETNPYDVRTIYVPIENAINVPDGFVAGERGIDGSDIERPVSIGFNQENFSFEIHAKTFIVFVVKITPKVCLISWSLSRKFELENIGWR